MSEIDAKVNMSLDEIIKMEKKDKKNKKPATATQKAGKGGAKRNRGGMTRGRGNFRGRSAPRNPKQNSIPGKSSQAWRLNRNQNQNLVQRGGGFVQKRYNKKGGLTRSRSNLNLAANRPLPKNNIRGGPAARRGRGGRAGLNRSRSRNNLTYTQQGGFYTGNNNNNNNNNKNLLKRTNSLPNLRDPTSVHNRLGYQSPAQVAYRNRVKRAKQVLLQRQHQRLNRPNEFRMPQVGKLTTLQQRALERRQQILTSQRRFNTGGLRSDQIVRAQRRAQYEQKMTRMNTARMITGSNVNFMCTLGNDYVRGIRQRSMSLSRNQGAGVNNLRQLPRGRSPFRQSMQGLNMVGRGQLFPQQQRPAARSRSRSRSRTRNIPVVDPEADVDDRSFSEVMYSLSGNLGVTGRTLNDRFSF